LSRSWIQGTLYFNTYKKTHFEKEERIAFTIDKTMLKSTAHKNPFTSKPGTRALASMIKSPFMISENNPSVRRLMGSAIRLIIGFMKRLIAPRTIATIKVVQILSMVTPACSKYAVIATAAAFMINLIRSDI